MRDRFTRGAYGFAIYSGLIAQVARPEGFRDGGGAVHATWKERWPGSAAVRPIFEMQRRRIDSRGSSMKLSTTDVRRDQFSGHRRLQSHALVSAE